MRLTLLALSSVFGVAGCARDVVMLEPIEEAEFELALFKAYCQGAARCGKLDFDSKEACVDYWTAASFAESKWLLPQLCPGAEYDPVQAAACLDQILHTPQDCSGLGSETTCPHMDWYRGACPMISMVP